MKRFLTALTFCTLLLTVGAFLITRSIRAKDDVITKLLSLPAPAPTGPNTKRIGAWRQADKKNPPKDDAPIDEILNYWEAQSDNYRDLSYNPKPTPRVLERIRAEIEKKPESVARFLNIFRDSGEGIDLVKRVYDNWPRNVKSEEHRKSRLKDWLRLNSPYFSEQVAKVANRAGEQGEYVSNQNEVLALAQHDWDAVRPSVDRLYSDMTNPVSRVLGMWALYKHALTENSLGDIDRYREELKAVVEDKKATAGMRDLAFDALVKEKEWNGRDEWYYTLLEDETLAELRINGSVYTGLTTIVIYSHPDKYADKMVELAKSGNPVVRNAAVRNLGVVVNEGKPEVIRALLPWLEDPKWAKDLGGTRAALTRALRSVKVPESVPGLIAALDEKETYYVDESNFNAMSNAANAVANAMNSVAWASNYSVNANRTATNANGGSSGKKREMTRYPLRSDAISALAIQADMRAAQPLRRILREVEPYERGAVVKAILASKGFTIAEQADALEAAAREAKVMKEEAESFAMTHGGAPNSNSVANSYPRTLMRVGQPVFSTEEMHLLLGMQLMQTAEPADALIRETVARISRLEKTEPDVADALRGVLLNWKGPVVNALFLKDLKDDRSSLEAVVKLLGVRKSLRETQADEVFDIRTGSPTAAGISACLLESDRDYAAILSGQDTEAKAAMLACARLIRAKLPVRTVAGYLSSTDKRLALAADRYLESEDSPEARRILHSVGPDQIRVLGATTAFWPEGKYESTLGTWALTQLEANTEEVPELDSESGRMYLVSLYIQRTRVTEFDDLEKRLKEEVKADDKLTAVYSYDDNYVHIHKDRVVFSWDEDDSRYRERTMSKDEFAELAGYFADQKVDEVGPFLSCRRDCEAGQLLMIGKQGGRRVFIAGDTGTEFVAGLDSIFDRLKLEPAKLRYRMEKDIPGLEILFADDSLSVETIWKNGADFRVLASDVEKQKTIEERLEEAVEEAEEAMDEASEEDGPPDDGQENRADTYAWYRFTEGRLSDRVEQPHGIDLLRGSADYRGSRGGGWKTKAAGVEVGLDEDGLTKIAAGRSTKLRSGNYESPVITPNGKWVFATKYGDAGIGVWRVNLATGREYKVESKDLITVRPIAFVPALNRMLLTPNFYEGVEEFDEMYVPGNSRYLLVDPETGATQPTAGEVRPLAQQSFRTLQAASGAHEFWAAIPDMAGRKTNVGIYNARTLTFKQVLSVPKIVFDSMQMWADPAAGKIYFVYKGHLLALPLPQTKTKPPEGGRLVRP